MSWARIIRSRGMHRHEENVPMKEDPLETRFDRFDQGFVRLEGGLSRVEGQMEQMDRRFPNLEQNHRQLIGIVVGSWITLMLAVLGLYFKG
jgi:hypothetical protein